MFNILKKKNGQLAFFLLLFFCSIDSYATRIIGVHLVDVTTNTELGFLQDGDVIDLAVLPQINLSAIPNGSFTKILFFVNGNFVRSEGAAPYAIAGDAGGVFNNWLHPGIGNHVFDIVAVNGLDTGEVTTLNIQILNSGSNPLYSLAEFTEPSCPGSINGTASANGFGGNAPYTYNWSTGAVTKQISNLSTGNYTVTITDNIGNTTQTLVSIINPLPLTVTANITNESCFGNDGIIALEFSGGTESYGIIWSNSETGTIVNNLSAGIYSVSVTDYYGCSTSGSYTINDDSLNTPFTTNVLIKTESCFGNDGSISFYYTGGTAPYNIQWSNGSTSDVIINLSQGTYTVTLSDANACSNQYEYNVPFDPLLGTFSIFSTILPENCNVNNSGSISLSVSGGNLPYSYVWSNGSSLNPATGLSTGNYTVTITEQNGCSTFQTYNVGFNNSNPSLNLNSIVDNESCLGNDGLISINPTGGTSPFLYSWGVGGTANCGDFLETDSLIIIEAENNNLVSDWTEETNVPGYTGNSYIEWRTGDTTITVLSPGVGVLSYFVNITHPGRYHFLIRSSTAEVSEFNDCYIRFKDSDILLRQGVNSFVSYADTVLKLFQNTSTQDWTWQTKGARGHIGGEIYTDFNTPGTYEFQIHGRSNQFKIDRIALVHINYSDSLAMDLSNLPSLINNCSSGILSGLNSGSYTLQLTDAKGCNLDTNFVISEFTGIPITSAIIQPGCLQNNGKIRLEVNGGKLPYSYLWNTVPNSTNSEISSLFPGIYNVVVTDNNGCTASKAIVLNSHSSISISDSIVSNQCQGVYNGAIYINSIGIYEYLWSNGSTSKDLTNITSGDYSLMVRDKTGCAVMYNYTVNAIQNLVLTETHTNESAPGASDGSALVNVNNGTEPYQFLWNTSPNQFTGYATTMPVGSYQCTVTDSIGCIQVISVDIN